jgi:hypothetical protein
VRAHQPHAQRGEAVELLLRRLRGDGEIHGIQIGQVALQRRKSGLVLEVLQVVVNLPHQDELVRRFRVPRHQFTTCTGLKKRGNKVK